MKTLNESFTDQEYKYMLEVKKRIGLNWHDFLSKWLMAAAINYYKYNGTEITKEQLISALIEMGIEAKTE